MPYDHQTPFGTTYGNLTPQEAAMSALRRAVGNPEDAMRAGVAESKALDAGDLSKDPFFASSAAAPAAAPTGGSMPALKQGDYGTDQYFQNRDIGRAQQQNAIVQTLRGRLQEGDLRGMMGQPGDGSGFALSDAPGAAPTVVQNDRIVPGGDGAAPPPAPPSPGGGGHLSQDQIEQMMMRQAMINGGSMPDILGMRSKAARDALELSAAQRAEDTAKKQFNVANATEANADNPQAQRTALKAAGAPMAAVAPEQALASDPMAVEMRRRLATQMRAALTSPTAQADAAILQPDINALVARLVNQGASAREAREFIMSGLADLKGGFNVKRAATSIARQTVPGGTPITDDRENQARVALGLPSLLR